MSKPILCLDFDGVIHSYTSGWCGEEVISDHPVPGAAEFMLNAMERFSVSVFSSRGRSFVGRKAMRQYITKMFAEQHATMQGRITPDANDWEIGRGEMLRIDFPDNKPGAFVTIDDRAITFLGKWPSIQELLDFKPWNKRPASPTCERMQRYVRRHIEIDAYCWDGSTNAPGITMLDEPVVEETHDTGAMKVVGSRKRPGVLTLSGPVPVDVGDWIVREPTGGGFYPVKDHVFKERYKLA